MTGSVTRVSEINAALRGHYAYYGVAGNIRTLFKVYRATPVAPLDKIGPIQGGSGFCFFVGVQADAVVISSSGEGNRAAESLEVKGAVGRETGQIGIGRRAT
jgi:hypothetical protein